MYIESDLSEIACPKCNNNNDVLEVIRMYVFTRSNYGKQPCYNIKCYNCNEVFTLQIYVSTDEI